MRLATLFLIAAVAFSCRNSPNANTCTVETNEHIFGEAPFRECHASTIIELKDGSLLSAWFAGTEEGNDDVGIWTAFKKEGLWSAPTEILNGVVSDSLRYPCWNPVLFRAAENVLSLYYKVGPNPRDWWGMVVHSTDEGQTWSAPEKLPEGILGPIKNKPVVLPSGVILSPSSIETNDDQWHSHIERSADGGKTWEKISIDPENPAKVIQPTLLLYPEGKIQALLRSNQNYIMESWSADEGKTWSPMATIPVLNPNSGIDAVTLQSGLQVLIYNPMESGKEWVNGRNKLNAAVSADGKNWQDVAVLEDQPSGEFSYPSVIQTSDQAVHVVYTSKRKSIKHVVLKF
ncbi:MAG: exo-alpha-sialidase [Prolixibacteraceae bacterium]|nr:exo-alpha-sialidase [Prolixibacteraceae bacterium]